MSVEKPASIEEYESWLENEFGYDRAPAEAYYDLMSNQLRRTFQDSNLWQSLTRKMEEFDTEYRDKCGYPLFMSLHSIPDLKVKPYASYLDKTFRLNALFSRVWERRPREGWIIPTKYKGTVNDVIRTNFVVKYLDGAEFLLTKIKALCDKMQIRFGHKNEARFEGGYYAVHAYASPTVSIPQYMAPDAQVAATYEIQITTQLKEVIKELVHGYYEERRLRLQKPNEEWAWQYDGDEFAPNYVGHLLHYVEGVIMQIRNKQKGAP